MNDHDKYKDIILKQHLMRPKATEPAPEPAPEPTPEPTPEPPAQPPAPNSKHFAVVSPCFYQNPFETVELVKTIKEQLKKEDITYITYGSGEKFTNKVYTNLLRLYTKLEEIELQYPLVLIIDAWDTLYLGGGAMLTLISKYNNLSKKDVPVIFAAEKRCYPKGSDIFYSGKENPDQYLNSGLIMGETTLIKVMIREMIQQYDLQRFEFSNGSLNHSQIYWHRYFNEGKLRENIKIDYDHDFFYCMDSCNPYKKLEMINRVKIKVKSTGTYPKLFHFNRCLVDGYKQYFGEFWVESLAKRSPGDPGNGRS
jgi:hypothetical protein